MKTRLHEIELGSNDPNRSKLFYNNILELDSFVDKDELKVFNAGVPGLDFNISKHLPAKVMVISFLTDDLQKIMENLTENHVLFEGPEPSHLGMNCISFNDPDGYLVKINQPTSESPNWLKV